MLIDIGNYINSEIEVLGVSLKFYISRTDLTIWKWFCKSFDGTRAVVSNHYSNLGILSESERISVWVIILNYGRN